VGGLCVVAVVVTSQSARGIVHAAWMEEMMSKTPMHNSEASPEVRELTKDQLDQVTGGKPSATPVRPTEYVVITMDDIIITNVHSGA
jgi:hypothetical protein